MASEERAFMGEDLHRVFSSEGEQYFDAACTPPIGSPLYAAPAPPSAPGTSARALLSAREDMINPDKINDLRDSDSEEGRENGDGDGGASVTTTGTEGSAQSAQSAQSLELDVFGTAQDYVEGFLSGGSASRNSEAAAEMLGQTSPMLSPSQRSTDGSIDTTSSQLSRQASALRSLWRGFDVSASGHKSRCPRRRSSSNVLKTAKGSIKFEKVHHRSRRGSKADYGRMALIQELEAHEGAIWCHAFSNDGRYLATAGTDKKVLVWKVAGDEAEQEVAEAYREEGLFEAIDLLSDEPFRIFLGHQGDIVDLSWSKNNFLLSASIDCSVRLWHPAKLHCLGEFRHPNFVTGVCFHPRNDRLFLTGCFDKRLRIWSIPDGRVINWAQAPEMITACCFGPTGKLAVAGCSDGRVVLYTSALKYFTQTHCRNRHGKDKRGKKVTGVSFVSSALINASGTPCGVRNRRDDQQSSEYALLVTTNDSRTRLIELDSFSTVSKFKGVTNGHIQIRAQCSEDGAYVICGSEDGSVYLWSTGRDASDGVEVERKDVFDRFAVGVQAKPLAVTTATFAPAAAVTSLFGVRDLDELAWAVLAEEALPPPSEGAGTPERGWVEEGGRSRASTATTPTTVATTSTSTPTPTKRPPRGSSHSTPSPGPENRAERTPSGSSKGRRGSSMERTGSISSLGSAERRSSSYLDAEQTDRCSGGIGRAGVRLMVTSDYHGMLRVFMHAGPAR
ncbi:unnamed protein product [Chrysoparadoxa australica]